LQVGSIIQESKLHFERNLWYS